MDVVCYAADSEGPGQRVTELLKSVIPREQLLICQTIGELTNRLLQPTQGVRAAVLLAHDLDQLHAFLTLRSLLEDTRIILILPDRDATTVAQGHTLRPRLLTYMDVDFTPLVVAVLQKIRAGLCPQDGCRSGEAQN
jgi:hypothetical protein